MTVRNNTFSHSSDPLPNGSTALAVTVIDELVRNGVKDLVLAPGSRSAAMALAAVDSPLRIWVEIDERSAGFFALGIAKAARTQGHETVAAVLTTSGTAAANLYPAVIEADESATPLLLLTADRPPEVRHAGANQAIDQIKLFGDRVRWFADLPPASDLPTEGPFWRSTICRAVAEACGRRTGGAGPVHVNLGFREPMVPASEDGRTQGEPYRSPTQGRAGQRPWTSVADRVLPRPTEIEVSGRLLVVAGAGAEIGMVSSALEAGAVVLAEGHSGCRIPGTITTAHHLLASPFFARSARADRVVLLGRTGLSRNLISYLADVDLTLVSQSGWPDPDRRALELIHAVHFRAGSVDGGWAELWSRAEKQARDTLDAMLDSLEAPAEPQVARAVAAAIPENGLLAVASSMPVRDLDWFAAAGNSVNVVANRGASGIDGFVSMALGAAAARPLVALAGDLSILHDQAGFLVRPRPDATFVVVNNGGGGIFSFLPQANYPEHFERLFGTPTGVDFASLAEAHDLSHMLVTGAGDLAPAIQKAMRSGGVHLLEVRTDRSANVELHRRITKEVVEAVELLLKG